MTDDLTKRSQPLDHLALRGDRDAPALLFKAMTITHGEMDRRVGRLAAILVGMGMQPGDRVATWLGKSWLACMMPLAAVRAGLVHVPVNPVLKRAQLAHILSDSGSRILITNAARGASLVEGDIPDGCAIADDTQLAAQAEADGQELSPSSRDPEELAAILYTSGSTGRPKGVMLSSRNMWLGAESVAAYLGLTTDDRVLGVLPLSFDYGQNQLLSSWYAGASVAPLDYLMPGEVVRAADRFAITTLAGVPPLWVQLIEIDWPLEVTQRMRRLTNSGGALTRHLVQRLGAIFPTTRIFAMYGLTEAFRSTYLDPALINERPDSVGKAIPHAEILIVRADGSPTDPDEPGELVHCGPLVAQGYWQDAERTALRFKPAPPHSHFGGIAVWSGDKARVDADGFITFVGRDDEMIKSSGNRISPTELEEAVQSTGLAAEAVALGIPDPALGHAIAIVVRPSASGGPDPETFEAALRARLRADLPNFMQPRHIIVRTDMPRNPNGKLDRVAIAAEANSALEAAA
ncbi:acyl-CoA ligase (AMP-forming), exosortase A system-associated [Sphingomonas lacunae]|uniref:Acyl-CoA ligase (AMP-forming), exosortase A system-associated n=1 Tax=Sphingomonas lacunae TaxID=2698828 RepID=A0A6M4AUC8_9SPHN|nr:acyl-CoA ligase (AMP-forming), exosortase A system-associated [Sphingomonas lacunae]QJQ32634.1 acyl-CoA ligase (AMP-forming), exosortase A system-associated [Sphingomonas lacunae]